MNRPTDRQIALISDSRQNFSGFADFAISMGGVFGPGFGLCLIYSTDHGDQPYSEMLSFLSWPGCAARQTWSNVKPRLKDQMFSPNMGLTSHKNRG